MTTAQIMLAWGLGWPALAVAVLVPVGKAIENADRRRKADMASWITAERER